MVGSSLKGLLLLHDKSSKLEQEPNVGLVYMTKSPYILKLCPTFQGYINIYDTFYFTYVYTVFSSIRL